MKIRILALLMVVMSSAHAQTKRTIQISPPLKKVTLYLSSMELEHQDNVALPAGTSRMLIQNTSTYLNSATSVEVRLGDGVEVLSIGDDQNDEEAAATPAALTAANRAAADSLLSAGDEVARLEAELTALEEEKAILVANRLVPSGTQANWGSELQKGAAIVHGRLVAIQLATRQFARQLEAQKVRVRALEARSRPAVQIKPYYVTVRAARAGTYPLLLRYGANRRATWRPMLEIRADEGGRTVQFVPSGKVFNRSGLNWDRVQLVLINEINEVDISQPKMEPWTLDSDGNDDHNGEGRVDAFVVKGTANGRNTETSQGTRYEVPEPVTMAAGEVRIIGMRPLTLASRTEFLALPKLSDKVFLQSKVSGWEGLHLPGSADVYYRGAYVGETDLEDRAYNDSLELSLGFDDRIIVGRTKLEDFSRNVGSQKRRVRLTYELNVRNLHPEPVRIKIQDQVPVSSEKEIQVKVLETSGAQLEERIGRLTWYLNLAANASQRLRFSFEVEFPKDNEVNIIRHEIKIKSPKFR